MAYIENVDKVIKNMANDLADIYEEIVQDHILKRAYKTGRFYRSVSSEIVNDGNTTELQVGTPLIYPVYLKVIPLIFGYIVIEEGLETWSK